MKPSLTLILCLFCAAVHGPALAQSQTTPKDEKPEPSTDQKTSAANSSGKIDEIEFSADKMDYDFEKDIVNASGNVIVNRDGYMLRADTIVWNRVTGEVIASGNIRSISPEGDVVYGDSIMLTDSLRDGVVENLLLIMEDGSRIAAHNGQRLQDGTLLLDNAAYTACAVLTDEGCPKNPSWQIKAVKVKYDPVKRRVTYDGARVEIFGLPVIPLPGLSHPVDGENRDGFLVPRVKYDTVNGASIAIPYYFNLAPNQDATVTTQIFTNVAPLVIGNFRQLDENGAFQLTGYATYSGRQSTNTSQANIDAEKDFRGYFTTNGRFRLNENWTVSESARIVSDSTFLRRYDISDDDNLRSTINLERTGETSYFSLAGWAFQTLRANDPQNQVPVALPAIDFRKRLEDPLLGGRLELQVNSLAISRSEGQDTQRAFTSARWDLRKLTNMGQEITFTGFARGDVYHSNDNELNPTSFYSGKGGWQGRAIVTAAVDVKWPFIGEAFGGTQTFTPRFQVVATPALSNLTLPNEDSRSIDLADSNLFSLNRFSGYDRYEDNVRASYGVEWEVNRPNLSFGTIIGQSYRLADNVNIAPDGTGLAERFSDIVGRNTVRFSDVVKFTHRFRLDKRSLAIRRNEIDTTIGSQNTYVQIGYLRLNRNISDQLEDLRDREEIRVGGRVQISKFWSVFGSGIVDLTDPGDDPTSTSDGYDPVRHRFGVAYDDGCISLGLTWRYDYEDTGDARRGSTFLFRLALRNLGV